MKWVICQVQEAYALFTIHTVYRVLMLVLWSMGIRSGQEVNGLFTRILLCPVVLPQSTLC